MSTHDPVLVHRLREFERCFQCPICCDRLTEPVQLMCSHLMCHQCLQHLIGASHSEDLAFESNQSNPKSRRKRKNGQFLCPTCRAVCTKRAYHSDGLMTQLIDQFDTLQRTIEDESGGVPLSQPVSLSIKSIKQAITVSPVKDPKSPFYSQPEHSTSQSINQSLSQSNNNHRTRRGLTLTIPSPDPSTRRPNKSNNSNEIENLNPQSANTPTRPAKRSRPETPNPSINTPNRKIKSESQSINQSMMPHSAPQTRRPTMSRFLRPRVPSCRWLLTHLDASQMATVTATANELSSDGRCHVQIVEAFDPSVTHLITSATQAKPIVSARTSKYFLAVLHGVPIVTIDWIVECLQRFEIVDSKTFCVHGDAKFPDGLSKSVDSQNSPLFTNYVFLTCGSWATVTRSNIIELVNIGGGGWREGEEFSEQDVKDSSITRIVLIDDTRPTSAKANFSSVTQDMRDHFKNDQAAELATAGWLFDCISNRTIRDMPNI